MQICVQKNGGDTSIPRIALAGAITQSIISFVNGTFEKWKEAKI